MGTPDFAVKSLDAIIRNNYNVKAVITAPDKKAGRGKKINYSEVKKYALEKNLKLLRVLIQKQESKFIKTDTQFGKAIFNYILSKKKSS